MTLFIHLCEVRVKPVNGRHDSITHRLKQMRFKHWYLGCQSGLPPRTGGGAFILATAALRRR